MKPIAVAFACAGALALPLACTPPAPPPPPPPHSAPAEPPPPPAALTSTAKDIALPGDANGLYWDAREHALYLTDRDADALVKWTDTGGLAKVAALPPAAKVDLGGITRLPDGTFVIASFGFGSDGAIITVAPDGHVATVPNLDPKRRRIGVASTHEGAVYDVYFVVDGKQHSGGVAKVDLGGVGETDLVTRGLGKPVGVAATKDGVYVTDQEPAALFAVHGEQLQPIATGLDGADLLTALPDGSLLTGGKAGAVVRIRLDGTHQQVAGGYQEVRGIAYDPDAKRLFVVDHAKGSGSRTIHVVPYAP